MSDSKRHFTRFTAIFAGGTMISRVLGLVRDMVTTALIPVESNDIFIVAFRFPNMLRDMLGEGAANAALVPVFTEGHEKNDAAGFKRLVSAVMGAMLLVFGAVTLAGILLVPFVPDLLRLLQPWTGASPGYISEFARSVPMMQWTFPYLLFIGLTVFATAPLFTVRHYSTPSWSPALLNVTTVLCCLLFYKRFSEPAWALVVGAWLGGIAQCAVMFYQMRKRTGVLLPSWNLGHPGVKHVFWLLVPVILGQATGEVNKLVDTLFAKSLGDGVVSALYVSNRLIQLPLSIFGIAVSVAILPELTRAAVRGDRQEMRQTLSEGFRQTFFLTAPAMIGLIVLAEPLVQLLFQRGQFNAGVASMTATCVVYCGAGLCSFSLVKVAVQGFYALRDTRTPVIVATFSMLLNIMLIFVLVNDWGFRGLALATTISYTVNFVLLFLLLHRHYGNLLDLKAWRALLAMSLATGAMGYGVHLMDRFVIAASVGSSYLYFAAAVILTVIAGALLYVVACKMLHVKEIDRFLSLLGRR